MTSVLKVTSPRTAIVERDLGRRRNLEADDRPLPRLHPRARLLDAAHPGRCRGISAAGRLRDPPCGRASSFAGGAEAVVRVAAGDQLVRVRRVQMEPLRLPIGTVRPADVGALVPVETQPAQILENPGLRLASGPLGVGVLDAQDERAVVAVREQPVEQRRARVADVQLTGGRRSEADPHPGCQRSRSVSAPSAARRHGPQSLRRGRPRPRLRSSCP